MSIDLRVKHDLESRRRAVELFDAGVGCKPATEALSVPRETVREWQWVYRAFGSEALLSMGGKQSRYTFEQRVAAASAVVDGGMAKADAMAEFGIRSKSPLERWCRLYREGGAEALRPGPKGRPRGSRSKPRARTRERELEERCRRLEAEVAYLKKCAPWSSGTGSDQGGGRGGGGVLGRRGTPCATCWSARGSGGRPTTTRWRTRGGRPGPSCATPRPRYSRAPPTAAGTGR